MFTAKVYTTAILSLSGMMEETYAAKETLRRYNQQRGQTTGKLFLPVDDAHDADVVIGLVGNHIEYAELIDDSLTAGRHVLLLFNAFADPKNTIASEQQAVNSFRTQMQSRCCCAQFNGKAQLEQLIEEQLEKI